MSVIDFELEPFLAASGWYVAFSGGIDSMVLLHLINRIRSLDPNSYPQLKAIHVNHGLSQNADLWERHCLIFCQSHNIPFYAERVSVENAGGGLESAAREARYQVFEKYLPSSSVLFLGHHLEDQIETFFLRLMRGAGLKGLKSIPHSRLLSRATLIRPLLKNTKAELEAYAQEHKLVAIQDSSNDDLSFDRNFLRHRLLPILESRWPGYRRTVARAIGHFHEVDRILEESLPRNISLVSQCGDPGLSISAMKEEGEENAKRMVRRFLTEQGLTMPNQASLNEFIRQIFYGSENSAALLKIRKRQIRRFREGIFLLPSLPDRCPEILRTMALNETITIEGIGSVCLRAGFNQKAIPIQGTKVALCWRSSERIAKSRQLRKKIKKIFNAKAIPPWWRDQVPIAINDNDLIAIGTFKNANFDLVDEPGLCLEWCPCDGIWSES